MKIQLRHFTQRAPNAPKRSEGGMITVIFIALMAIMLILVMAESRALIQLHRELKFLEQQQIKRERQADFEMQRQLEEDYKKVQTVSAAQPGT